MIVTTDTNITNFNYLFEKYKNTIIKPSQIELAKNNPSRSAKLRFAIRSKNKFFYPDDLLKKFEGKINKEQNFIKESLIKTVINPIISNYDIPFSGNIIVNGTGRFVKGGPGADTGLTGRKIIVDTYGGYARHGGGAFSGKDPSKVDRSAAYMARYVAKKVVSSGLAERCELQLAYSIGVAEPVSILIDTFGTGKINDQKITKIVKDNFDFRPYSIIKYLNLKQPIYGKLAAYGHLGREGFPWEEDKKNKKFDQSVKENLLWKMI